MFRTDLIAAAAAVMIAIVAPQQQLTGEFWNGSRGNGVLTDETALCDDTIDALLAAIDPVKIAA
jgi:hypothetical protein